MCSSSIPPSVHRPVSYTHLDVYKRQVDERVLGVIYLKDTVKPGLAQRFERLRKIGIKTIMCTGDNPLTAATIAAEAGVDGYIAECKPEDKIDAIKKEQAEGKMCIRDRF